MGSNISRSWVNVRSYAGTLWASVVSLQPLLDKLTGRKNEVGKELDCESEQAWDRKRQKSCFCPHWKQQLANFYFSFLKPNNVPLDEHLMAIKTEEGKPGITSVCADISRSTRLHSGNTGVLGWFWVLLLPTCPLKSWKLANIVPMCAHQTLTSLWASHPHHAYGTYFGVVINKERKKKLIITRTGCCQNGALEEGKHIRRIV